MLSVEGTTEAGTGAPHVHGDQCDSGVSLERRNDGEHKCRDQRRWQGIGSPLHGLSSPKQSHRHRGHGAEEIAHATFRLFSTDLDAAASFPHHVDILQEPSPCVPCDPFPGILFARSLRSMRRLAPRWVALVPAHESPTQGIMGRAWTLGWNMHDPTALCWHRASPRCEALDVRVLRFWFFIHNDATILSDVPHTVLSQWFTCMPKREDVAASISHRHPHLLLWMLRSHTCDARTRIVPCAFVSP